MVTAPINAKSPGAGTPGPEGTNPPIPRKAQVPMAVTVQDGRPRRCLRLVGDDTPRFEVPREINVDALASALNATLNGVPPGDEVAGFNALLAAAFVQGAEHERSLAGVA